MQTSELCSEIMRLARLAHDSAKQIENIGTTEPGTLGRLTALQTPFDDLATLLTRVSDASTAAGSAFTALKATFPNVT